MSTSAPGHEPLFERASRDVLDYLHAHVPLAFWAVTRVENGRQTYLSVQDSAYGLSAGGSHPWDASFCIHMAAGAAPHIAPDAQAVPLYAAAGVNRLIDIGADESESYRQMADPTAVVVIDLDELKVVNDGEGHAAGDELLRRAARAISSAVRGDDPVARLGGDEFGVLLRSCSQEAATERAQQIREALGASGVSASVGVAAAMPDADLTAAQEAADEAMYAEKRARRAAPRG